MARRRLVVILEATLGGIRKHVVDLLIGLDKSLYEITFVYSRERADSIFLSDLSKLSSLGIKLIEVRMYRAINPYLDLRALIALSRILGKIKPDILHLHGAKAGALGRLAAYIHRTTNLVYTPHGGSFHKFSGMIGLMYLAIERILSNSNVHFVGVSKNSCESIKEYLKIQNKNIHLIYNAIELNEIDKKKNDCTLTRHQIGIADDRFVVLYPSLFLEAKGHMQFLDALEFGGEVLVPQILILLAGDGPLLEPTRRRIQALGLEGHFRFLGFRKDIYDYYNISDIVILPSREEVFGYVLLEAMAFSKPIIATRVGGIPEVVEHGYNGELVSPNAIPKMIGRLNYLSKHPVELNKMGRNARKKVESGFALPVLIQETESLYERILNPRSMR